MISGHSCFSVFASVALLAVAGVSSQSAAVLVNPPVETGPLALDPVNGPLAGRQNITIRAGGAPAKEALLATPGFMVVQSFPGFDGAVRSPINRIDFTDGRLAITFTINATVGYGGCQAGANEKSAFTSGPASGAEGVAIYIGDNVNDTAYTIEFSDPVRAAGFTLARTLEQMSGSSPNWAASFYDAQGNLLERQFATPGMGANVAVLFGRITPGGSAPIKRIVVGRDTPGTPFVMGNGAIFLDDLGFAPLGTAAAATAQISGGVARPPLALAMGGAGGESVDFPANGASPQTFLQSLEGFGVVQDWTNFVGVGRGARETINTLDFENGLDFRFRLQVQADGAEGLGGVSVEPALAVSPREALRIGGPGGLRRLEIVAGMYDERTGGFVADGAVYAAGFVITNLVSGEVRATFFNRAGEVISTQTAQGMAEPANADQPTARRGAEVFFGHIASSPSDESRWVHRIRIEDRDAGDWGLDDFGFTLAP
ncbi:MAG: hypothetical protein MUE42_00610 [Opitutaceae bacterium]|jgi:hypothetical protein|nr:hypothetical protein [Opitutaceae bacterium]